MHSYGEGNAPPSPDTAGIRTSMIERLGGDLTGLVARMESEIRQRGMVTQASASELRDLRLEAERFFDATRETHP